MSSLAADIAGAAAALGAVPGYVTALVAVVAVGRVLAASITTSFSASTTRIGLGALASYVASLVAVVAGWLVSGLVAVFGDVANPVASVTAVLCFLTLPCKMSKAVALVAFLSGVSAIASAITATTV